SASGDRHKVAETSRHLTAPAITPSADEPKGALKEEVPGDTVNSTEALGETSYSENTRIASTALKHMRDEAGERDKTSSTNNEGAPAKTSQARCPV
ncbi:hypothetical protein MRX96_048444, partial [Rhipicephalus microplus]